MTGSGFPAYRSSVDSSNPRKALASSGKLAADLITQYQKDPGFSKARENRRRKREYKRATTTVVYPNDQPNSWGCTEIAGTFRQIEKDFGYKAKIYGKIGSNKRVYICLKSKDLNVFNFKKDKSLPLEAQGLIEFYLQEVLTPLEITADKISWSIVKPGAANKSKFVVDKEIPRDYLPNTNNYWIPKQGDEFDASKCSGDKMLPDYRS